MNQISNKELKSSLLCVLIVSYLCVGAGPCDALPVHKTENTQAQQQVTKQADAKKEDDQKEVFTSIATGENFVAFIKNGAVWFFGKNEHKVFSNNESIGSVLASSPTQVPGWEKDVTLIAAGGNTLCAKVAGRLECRGEFNINVSGTRPLTQQARRLLTQVHSVTVGKSHVCFTAGSEKKVYCSGKNEFGQMGLGTQFVAGNDPSTGRPLANDHFALKPVMTLKKIRETIPGPARPTLDLSNLGQLAQFAPVVNSLLGGGAPTSVEQTVERLSELQGVESLGSGDHFTCGVVEQNQRKEIHCWGDLAGTKVVDQYKLGEQAFAQSESDRRDAAAGIPIVPRLPNNVVSTTSDQYIHGQVSTIAIPFPGYYPSSSDVAVSGGNSHLCVTADGTLYCLGNQDALGINTNHDQSIEDPILTSHSGVQKIAAGSDFTLIVQEGLLKSFGENTYGQLGHGSVEPSAEPKEVVGDLRNQPILHISASGNIGCASTVSQLYCFGDIPNILWGSTPILIPTPQE